MSQRTASFTMKVLMTLMQELQTALARVTAAGTCTSPVRLVRYMLPRNDADGRKNMWSTPSASETVRQLATACGERNVLSTVTASGRTLYSRTMSEST